MILKIENEIDRREVEAKGNELRKYLKSHFAREFGKALIDKFEMQEEEKNDHPYIPKINFHAEVVVMSKEELKSIIGDLKLFKETCSYNHKLIDDIIERLRS